MIDFLVPATDGGAAAQAVGLAIVGPVAIALSWRHHELRLFVIGVVVMAVAWMALRTVH